MQPSEPRSPIVGGGERIRSPNLAMAAAIAGFAEARPSPNAASGDGGFARKMQICKVNLPNPRFAGDIADHGEAVRRCMTL